MVTRMLSRGSGGTNDRATRDLGLTAADPTARSAGLPSRDNGPEFVAKAVKIWLSQQGIQTAYIEAGKPWQNATNESFNGKLPDECLNLEWFRHRLEAQVVIEQWRQQYNEQRPHSSLRYRTPTQAQVSYYKSRFLSS